MENQTSIACLQAHSNNSKHPLAVLNCCGQVGDHVFITELVGLAGNRIRPVRSVFKKSLTGPTLLEMYDNRVNQELGRP
jgi:hypothetical protein